MSHNIWLVYLGYGMLGGMRARHRLYLAGLDPDPMVPRPARHGDRHGDHGLRRRRLHRLAAVGLADEAVLHRHPRRRRRNLHRLGRDLRLLHDGGAAIVRVPPPGWAPAATSPPAQSRSWSPRRTCLVYQALQTPQFWLIWCVLCLNVTAGIGVLGQASAMSQEMFPGKVTRHRGGRLRRADEPVQHGRAVLLGVGVGLHRPQEHLRRVLRPGRGALFAGAAGPARWAASRCSCCASASSSACMAAASPPCRPICATCSARAMSARSTACC